MGPFPDQRPEEVLMGAEEERVVLELLRAAEGRTQDVDGMCARMSEDIVWQINVPLAPVVVGRDAVRAEIERQNTVSSGLLPGSEIRAIASNDLTVFTERVDVVELGGKALSIHINGLFEVRDGAVSAWREYFDSSDLAQQLGVDPKVLYWGIGEGDD